MRVARVSGGSCRFRGVIMSRRNKVSDAPTPRRGQSIEDAPRTPGASAPGKAEDEEQLKRNRERLKVDDEHKTPEMEKGHRGTFP
jgi:hypothetical protein